MSTVAQPDDLGADVNTWVNVVRRARLRRTTKYIALLLVTYAGPDGTRVYPGVARLAIQSGFSYRTVQAELQRLRAVGLVERLPRQGVPRHFADGYRLILGPEVLERASVPSPAVEDAAVEALRALYRGKHRGGKNAGSKPPRHAVTHGKTSARNPDGVQNDDCTQWDGATARNDPSPDLHQRQTTLHRPVPGSNPPSADADVRCLGTGSTRARASNGHPYFGSNPAADHQQAELAKFEAWMKENAQ